ncbi:MAG TPA: glycoside hydrolase family 66 protein [Ktedonobacterales bacterium]|nr:glycoside hydrolase family 66 protein [Ktedonobacterales bacterium]
MIAISGLWPDKAAYPPGEAVTLSIVIENDAPSSQAAQLTMRVLHLQTVVHTQEEARTFAPGRTMLTISLHLPPGPFRGYGIDVQVEDTQQQMLLATRSTAVDVLNDWTQAPRYGFLADFAPDALEPETALESLNRYHINVVQFYDWMWRHHILMPPDDSQPYVDALGRHLSLATVRAKARACHARNMATMGYAAVYGAEGEYALEHPDEMLYNAAGEPHSLERIFYIMNTHEGNPWLRQILPEMARAAAEVPFDGLHLDQYGFPHEDAFGPPPESRHYDLAADFQAFIGKARAAIQLPTAEKRVIFNAVDNWPIEAVADTEQDALYIEVWPPYEHYCDLQYLVRNAHQLEPAKQVIIAAYMKPLKTCAPESYAEAEAAVRLVSATLWANGGFHLLLGERDAALQDAYYPDYVSLTPAFAEVMRRYYDFHVRYENLLSDRRMRPQEDTRVVIDGAPSSTTGEAGAIWTIARAMEGWRTVSLINLMSASDTRWNVPAAVPRPLTDLLVRVRLDAQEVVVAVFCASPDGDGRPLALPFSVQKQDGVAWVETRVPRLEFWQVLALETRPRADPA